MENEYISRALASFFPALIMFLSCRWLGISHEQALFAAAAPMVLGTLNIMRRAIFSLTACVFILAILAHVFPAQYEIAKEVITGRLNQEKAAVETHAGGAAMSPSPSRSGSMAQPIQPPVLSGSNIEMSPLPAISASTTPLISGSSTLTK